MKCLLRGTPGLRASIPGFRPPPVSNEPVLEYRPGSVERAEMREAINQMLSTEIEIPMYIGSEEVKSGDLKRVIQPHDHKHTLGHFHKSGKSHVQQPSLSLWIVIVSLQAIDAAVAAQPGWQNAAELVSGPYARKINAATMLGQSKNLHQAEIDAHCETADFFRYNVQYMTDLYTIQPESSPGVWNRLDYRPLEGFVYALSPFNFTAIAANLPTSAAMMGNVVVWKPSNTQVYAANVLMEIFKKAGVPDRVINLVYPSGQDAADVIFKDTNFAGIHFTGSSGVFSSVWKEIGNNLGTYKSYPRIVGETGGKDFTLAHPSADPREVAVALEICANMTMGPTYEFEHPINAVIDEASFDNLSRYIDEAKSADDAEVVIGGKCDKSVGYFISPTVIATSNPQYTTMCHELFGPVLTVFKYKTQGKTWWEDACNLVDSTSPYALTGCLFATERAAISSGSRMLRNSAGNFYINDKCTGAVVGQQPFGGARGSGTNDKAGSMLNLVRWVQARNIKETFVSPTEFLMPSQAPGI
eukprot:gene6144-1098_t